MIEDITEAEYCGLKAIMAVTAEADIDDMELHEEGSHRALYNYISKTIGLKVKAGRGPVFHKAKALIEKYEGRDAQ